MGTHHGLRAMPCRWMTTMTTLLSFVLHPFAYGKQTHTPITTHPTNTAPPPSTAIQNLPCYTFICQHPTLHCPKWVTYPMPPYIRPALHHPMLDLPYTGNLSYPALCQTYSTPPYVGDLPYTALHRRPSLHRPTPTTYLILTTYPTLSSLSICELPLATTPSTPSPDLQVHERFLFRMVPHTVIIYR